MEPNNNPTQNPNQSTGVFPGMTPVSPVTPTSAAAPVAPTTPVQPNQPVQPLQPTQPIPPTRSMQPAQPIQPAQPMQPTSPILSSSAAQPTQPVGAASLDLSTPATTSQPETSSAGDGLIGHSFSVDKSQNDGNSTPNPFNSTSNSNPMTSPLTQSDFGTSFASGIENNNSGPFGGVISSNTNTTNSVAFNDPAKTTSNNQSVGKDGLSRKPKKTNLIVLITVAVVVIIALVVVLVMQMNGGGLSSGMQDGTISDSGEVEDAWEVMKGTLLVCEMKPLEKINDQDVESATVTYLVEDNKITTTSVSLEILDEDGEVGFMKELSSYDGLFMGENIDVNEIIDGDGTLKVDLQVFANRLAELLDGDSRLENVSCTVELT